MNLNHEERQIYHQKCEDEKSKPRRDCRGRPCTPTHALNMGRAVDNIPISIPDYQIDSVFCGPAKPNLHFSEKSFEQFLRGEHRKMCSSLLSVENAREARRNSGGDNRLVITRKSPTNNYSVNSRQTALRIYHRRWSGEYRVSVESFTRLQEPPQAQCGERYTSKLTDGAASKIKDAGAYVAACKKGFKTFGTLTLDREARARVMKPVAQFVELREGGEFLNGERLEGQTSVIKFEPLSTLGKEVSRFMDGLQKKYSRGWTWKPSAKQLEENPDMNWRPVKHLPQFVGVKHSKHGPIPVAKKINYVWVAENPPKIVDMPFLKTPGENGKCKINDNPHVHFLMDWGVQRSRFDGWAEQLEKLWGNGFNHLEKIKDPRSATGYLLKALGYMTKGAHILDASTGEIHNSQGIIRGNRYGISRDARAPDWECISEFEAEHMGQVLREVGEQIQLESGAIKARLKHESDAIKKQKAELAKLNNPNYRARLPQKTLAQRMERAKAQIKEKESAARKISAMQRNMDYSNKYKITFRKKHSLDKFIEYAVLKHGWKASLMQHVKQAAHIVPEAKKISEWAAKQAEDISLKVKEAAKNLECYWASVINDAEAMV